MKERIKRAYAVIGQDGPGYAHNDHRDNAYSHFAAWETARRIGGLEDQVYVQDCAEPEYGGQEVDIADCQPDSLGKHTRLRLFRSALVRLSKGFAGRCQFAATTGIKMAGGAAFAGLFGILLGGASQLRCKQHE